ncbi:MAG: hypothetical protein RR642_16610, partial [Solibacillus sp.]
VQTRNAFIIRFYCIGAGYHVSRFMAVMTGIGIGITDKNYRGHTVPYSINKSLHKQYIITYFQF